MRKILSTLCVMLVTVTLCAQSPLDVPKFKGHLLEGTIQDFSKLLIADGFEEFEFDSVTVYRGRFAGFKEAFCLLVPKENSDELEGVGVAFGWETHGMSKKEALFKDWNTIYKQFLRFERMLTEKYGEPSQTERTFESYSGDDPWMKFQQLKEGKCNYYTTWGTEETKLNVALFLLMAYSTPIILISYFNTEKTVSSSE